MRLLVEKGIINQRYAENPVSLIFPKRWSPRAMSGEEVTGDEIMSLFEAARWAPSSFNNQPWRFLYAMKNTSDWDIFFNLLSLGNKRWADKAWILMVIISKETFDFNGKPSRTHSFDTGSAWENLALQGSIIGLVVHGMQGFDYERAKEELEIPEGYNVEAMAAIGRPGKIEDLPDDLQKTEFPKERKPISLIFAPGKFKW